MSTAEDFKLNINKPKVINLVKERDEQIKKLEKKVLFSQKNAYISQRNFFKKTVAKQLYKNNLKFF